MIHLKIFLVLFLTIGVSTSLPAQTTAHSSPLSPCATLSAFPDTLSFPLTPIGSADTLSFVIKNTGDLTWAPNTPLITPNDGSFSLLSFATDSIGPGGSKNVTVVFSRQSVQNYSDTITFPDAGPCGNSLSIILNGQGGCAHVSSPDSTISISGKSGTIMSFTVRIDNTGNYVWNSGSPIITGPGKACFIIESIGFLRIPAGSDVIITIKCNLMDSGECCSTLSFPNAGPCSNSLQIKMCGIGIKSNVKESLNSDDFTLDQNFPNPFPDKTSFSYSTPKETELNIALYDLSGKPIKTIISGRVSEGKHLVSFDASYLPSGTYIYVLKSGSTRLSRELILAK